MSILQVATQVKDDIPGLMKKKMRKLSVDRMLKSKKSKFMEKLMKKKKSLSNESSRKSNSEFYSGSSFDSQMDDFRIRDADDISYNDD